MQVKGEKKKDLTLCFPKWISESCWLFRQPGELPNNWDGSHAHSIELCLTAISIQGPALTGKCSLVRCGLPGTQRRRSTRWSARRWPSCRRPCRRPSGKPMTWSQPSAPRWSARWRRPSGRRRRTRWPSSISRRIQARWGAGRGFQGKQIISTNASARVWVQEVTNKSGYWILDKPIFGGVGIRIIWGEF